MMMNLNSRMLTRYIIGDTVSNELSINSRRPVFANLHGGVSITREERTDSFEDCKHQFYKPCGVKRTNARRKTFSE